MTVSGSAPSYAGATSKMISGWEWRPLLLALQETVHSDIDQLARRSGSAATDRVEFLARQFIVMGLLALQETVHSDIDQLARRSGSAATDRVEFLARQFIVMGKERLDLVQQFRTKVVQRRDMRMTAAAGCYCEQPIVLDPFTFLLALLCLDDPDQSGGEHATNRGRGIQQDEHV
jgi:hypothetical protein